VRETVVCGTGLHGGREGRVVLRARPGPVALCAGGARVLARGLRVVAVDHATTVAIGHVRVATVEHLLAACAGTGIHEGLEIEIEGQELPLLDGGAARWCDALAELEIPSSRPPLVVHEAGVVDVGASRYTFAPGARQLRVHVDYGDLRLAREASWAGDARDFRARIAPARTFAYTADLSELAHKSLAWHASPESVILLSADEVFCAGRPFEADELARHKLLDLAGDLFIYGGPPQGIVEAIRPGHAATHEAMRIALHRALVGAL
jgi:UDP-3-O-[3-hydroxymyristoyl] N-acetylglucosamine deacetylase